MLLPAVIALGFATPAAAVTFYVDNTNPAAFDGGPGTPSQPFRTLGYAMLRVSAGNAVTVLSGTYREQVDPPAGSSGAPVVVQAQRRVVIDGADSLAASAWQPVSGNVYLAAAVNWAPQQVFGDGARLAIDSTAASGSLIGNRSYRYVAGTGLYVNAGGGNPATHAVEVGHRLHGIELSGHAWVTLLGFTVTRTDDAGIFLTNTNHCVVAHDTVTFARFHGIKCVGSPNLLVERNLASDNGDHGLYFVSGVSGSTVRFNESLRNARPTVRAANGIQFDHSPHNWVEGNLLHDNQDSGLQINAHSDSNTCIQNRSWKNGDHGYDHLMVTGNVHIGDVAWGNFKDGFSIEGISPANQLYDCIASDNGLTTNEFDLWVDASSTPGFVSDYNMFWNSTAQAPVKYIATLYPTVAAYSVVSGQDAHSVQSNPRFVNPAAGDLHLLAGSPAIDAAITSVANWPATDAEGQARADDPGTPNTGSGPVPFADRGALEYIVPNLPPVAALTITPASGAAPLAVTANASASTDPEHAIATYRFDFGDGTVIGPQASPLANHSYAAGNWTAQVTVADSGGLTSTATAPVAVAAPDRAPLLSAATNLFATSGQAFVLTVTASDPDGDAIDSLTADLSDLPPADGAVFTSNPSGTSGTLTWTPGLGDDAGPFEVSLTASNALTASINRTIHVGRPPRVTVAPAVAGAEGRVVMVQVAAMDPDSDPIDSLTADVSALPAGSGARFTVNAGHTAGTLTWTPSYTDARPAPYVIVFRAVNALSGSAPCAVTIANTDRAPRVTVPATVQANERGTVTVNVTAVDPDGDPIDALTTGPSGLPAGNDATFVVNADHTAGTFTWTPGWDDARGMPYTVVFQASNAATGQGRAEIQVANVDRPPVVSAPQVVAGSEGSLARIHVTATDPDGDAIPSLVADFSALPPSNNARFTPGDGSGPGGTVATPVHGGATARVAIPARGAETSGNATLSAPAGGHVVAHGTPAAGSSATGPRQEGPGDAPGPDSGEQPPLIYTFEWTPGFHDGPRSYVVTFTASNALQSSTSTTITVANTDLPPVVSVPDSVTVNAGQTVQVAVSVTDPDGDAIDSLTVDASSVPPDTTIRFVVSPDHTSATWFWTPDSSAVRDSVYRVAFTAWNALSAPAATAVRVRPAALATRALAVVAGGSAAATTATPGDPIPGVLALSNPYPDPMRAGVTFALALPRAARVTWEVFGVDGRRVWSLDEWRAAGRIRQTWQPRSPRGALAPGLYVVQVRVGDARFTRRFVKL